MDGIDSRIEFLMVSHLAKEISEHDEVELLRWIQASSQNKATFESYQKVWSLSEKSLVAQQIDCDCDWQKLKNKLFTPKPKALNFTWVARIAAIFLLVLTIGSLSILFFEKSSDTISYTAHGSVKSVLLPDGSRVILNNGASIAIESNFLANSRVVNLKGEAFFQVTHNPNSKFTVETKMGKVEVVGTRFSVKSPNESSLMEVKVEQGIVNVLVEEQSQTLIKGEKIRSENGQLSKKEVLEANELAWKSSTIVFKAALLQEITEQLIVSYSLFDSCQILSPDVTTKVTTSFENQPIEVVLAELSAHFGKKFTITNRTLVISN